jgi:DNA-binding transcriptional LysR family regulator
LSASDSVEDLLQREADIAVRMVEPSQDALLARHIGTIHLGFFARRDYLEEYGEPQTMEDLRNHRLIGFDRQTAFIRAMTKRYPMFEGITFAFRSDHSIVLLNAVRCGLGIGFFQIPLAARQADLVRLLPDMTVSLDTWVVMHENLKSSPRCRVAFDALVEGLKDYIADPGYR